MLPCLLVSLYNHQAFSFFVSDQLIAFSFFTVNVFFPAKWSVCAKWCV